MRSMIYNAPIIDRTLEPRVTQSLACAPAGSADVATDPLSWSTVLRPLSDANQANELHGYFSMEPQEVASADHSNQQYSITAVTTSAGAVAERYAYSAYGEPTICDASGSPLATQVSSLGNRYKYTGREWDDTVGLHHFRARWMSPKTGAFLSRDTSGYLGSPWNLREFLSGRPHIFTDPHGLCYEKIHETDIADPCAGMPLPCYADYWESDSKHESGWDGIPFLGIDTWSSTSKWTASANESEFSMSTQNDTTFLDGGIANDGGWLPSGLGASSSKVSIVCHFHCEGTPGECFAMVNCEVDPPSGKSVSEFGGAKSISLAERHVDSNGPYATVTISTQSFWIRDGQSVGVGVGVIEIPFSSQDEVIAADLQKNKYVRFKCDS